MSWPTAHAAFVDHAGRLLAEPAAPDVLRIDETRRGRPRWSRNDDDSWSRLERFETNFVDLSGPGGLLGQTAGRTAKSVVAWLDERGQDFPLNFEEPVNRAISTPTRLDVDLSDDLVRHAADAAVGAPPKATVRNHHPSPGGPQVIQAA